VEEEMYTINTAWVLLDKKPQGGGFGLERRKVGPKGFE
jgi:hypothetical protein